MVICGLDWIGTRHGPAELTNRGIIFKLDQTTDYDCRSTGNAPSLRRAQQAVVDPFLTSTVFWPKHDRHRPYGRTYRKSSSATCFFYRPDFRQTPPDYTPCYLSSTTMSQAKDCISADGTRIYADATGNPQNPSVVFAHGFALSGIVFDKLFSDARMLEKLYLVRYDIRGYGRSGKPPGAASYDSALYAADFAAVVREFALDKPVFVGWSAGAPIISDICAHISPCPLSGAIAMSGALCPATARKTLLPALLNMFPKFSSSDATTALTVRPLFIDALFTDPSTVPWDIKALWLAATVALTPDITHAITAGHKSAACQDALTRLGKEGFPVMVLYGTEDTFQSGKVAVQEAKEYFTDFTDAPVEGSSHAVFYDNLDETVGYILPFCLRVNGQS
ncbi:Alpha/Beta hydrolase protein [Mycena amicta]|nr:Alpha/Beta hydrolase protein [Mycena amicta]